MTELTQAVKNQAKDVIMFILRIMESLKVLEKKSDMIKL